MTAVSLHCTTLDKRILKSNDSSFLSKIKRLMTLREISLPKGTSSTAARTTTVDQQKMAGASHRRSLEIKRLRSTCRDEEDRRGPRRSHGTVSVMGRRREMEDAVKVEERVYGKYDYFGVYDGHGGSHVAEECRDRMHEILREEVERWDTWREKDGCDDDLIDWEVVMENCFERMDEEVGRRGGGGERRGSKNKVEETTVGSTVVVAIVGEEEVVVANCGDSRAVICRDGVALPLSLDHKPDRPDELARIEDAGGRVINWNGYRVLGVLATSRSIGDHYLKPYISSKPEITISKRTEADEFLILASDGLWDVISNEVACKVVRRCLRGRIRSEWIFNKISNINTSRAEVAAVLLTELAIAKGSKDNISVIVVELPKFRRFSCS